MQSMEQLGTQAKHSAYGLATIGSARKNQALLAMAHRLEQEMPRILSANAQDLLAAEQNGMTTAMVDRLRLSEERIGAMADGVRYVASLDDPVGRVLEGHTTEDGLEIIKKTVPLGVVGIIFESRPNVTVDCAALCLKSGNACVLRGGKEAIHSNTALVAVLHEALDGMGFDAGCIQLVEDTSRETAAQMMKLNGLIDVLIPRGGRGLIRSVVENATVPVIETGAGNCHVYVDAAADLSMAVDIAHNAKTSRPSVCNAAETLLVHSAVAEEFLPLAAKRMASHNVELRGCARTQAILAKTGLPCTAATREDWGTEYGDYILAVRVVDDIAQAISHIEQYSTHHSECIVTGDYAASRQFTSQVDSAAVYVNASTRFTDGGEFGLGAEIGISTQKLHARGPMGIGSLTSSKYIITGSGQIRE